MVEVTVEAATGKTTVDKMTLMCDCGKINNRLVVDGQNWGGLAQGIGLALSEDFEDIEKHATMLGAGFPYIKDIPDAMELNYFEESRAEEPGQDDSERRHPSEDIVDSVVRGQGVHGDV